MPTRREGPQERTGGKPIPGRRALPAGEPTPNATSRATRPPRSRRSTRSDEVERPDDAPTCAARRGHRRDRGIGRERAGRQERGSRGDHDRRHRPGERDGREGEKTEAGDLPRRRRTGSRIAHRRSGGPERTRNRLSTTRTLSGRFRASARGWASSTTRPRKAKDLQQPISFFATCFAMTSCSRSFPTNTIFSPDWFGYLDAMQDFLCEPRTTEMHSCREK